MFSRIPLSVVLSAPGQRHAIPHATLMLPVDGPFFAYLASDDTRLPNHPYLNGRGVDPTEYDTFVGEDVWNELDNTVHSSSSEDGDEGNENGADATGGGQKRKKLVRHADLIYDDVVEWLVQVLDADWARDGVVVCGRYVVADDATWAVPSRAPTVYTPREAFMVMRCSCKFLHDVDFQRKRGGTRGMGELTVAKAMAGSAAKEMRAFVPYRLTRKPHASSPAAAMAVQAPVLTVEGGPGDWELSQPLWSYAGVSQRHTDVCFPSLMAWSEAEHHEHFSLMMERLRKSQLLERTCQTEPAFVSNLVRRWVRGERDRASERGANASSARREGGPTVTSPALPEDGFCLLLAVDLLFESASLPIQLLSARVQLFAAEEGGDLPAHVGLAVAPYIREPAEDGEARADGEGGSTLENPASHDGEAHASESGDEGEEEGIEDITSFFRLFRNEVNWNHYVEKMEARWEEAAREMMRGGGPGEQGHTAIPASVLPDVKVSQYCVVASEAEDLVTCADTLTKRGLPLELLHPELLQAGSQQGMEFLKGLSERLLQEAKQQHKQ